MSTIKKLANQTVIYGLSSILGRIINFLLVPIYVRVFVPAEYGISVEIYAYFTFLNILYTYGMETTFFRFANNSENPRKVFSTSFFSLFASTLIFSLVLFIFRNPIAADLGYANREMYLTWIILILAFDTIAVVPFSLLRQSERPIKFALIKTINILVNVFFNLFFLIACPYVLKHGQFAFLHGFINMVYSPDIGIGYIFISNLISSAVTLIFLTKEFMMFNFEIDFKMLKKMLIYSAPLVIVGFAGMINDSLDRTILKHLLPYDAYRNEEILGIYGANLKLAILMVLMIQAFRYAAEPFFFIQSKQTDAKQTYAVVMKYFVIAGLFLFLLVTLYIDIFKYFIGSRGSLYLTGLGIVPILLMSYLVLGIYYNLSIWYKLEDKTTMGAVIAVIGAALTIVLNIVLIPIWGYYACAATKLLCYVVMVILSYIFAQKYYPVKYPLKSVGFYFILTMIIYFADLLVKDYISVDNASVSLLTGSFFMLIFVIIVIRKEGRSELIRNLIRKKTS
jgi:O-antigen/teichoic acid export membrane protein